VTDHWLIVPGNEFPIVCAGLRWTGIDARGVAISPGLDAWSGCAEKIILWKKRPTSTAGMQATRLLLFPISYPFGKIFTDIAGRLVTIGHEQEGGMIPVGFYNPVTLFIKPRIYRVTFSQESTLVCPRGALHLKIHSKFIAGNESRLGRTIRMKTNMV
jgi:hypothetical protein